MARRAHLLPQTNQPPTALPTIVITPPSPSTQPAFLPIPSDYSGFDGLYGEPLITLNLNMNAFLRAGMVAMQLHNPTHEPVDGPVPPELQTPEAQTTEQPYSPPGAAGEPTVTYDPQTGAMEVSGDLPFPDTFFDFFP